MPVDFLTVLVASALRSLSKLRRDKAGSCSAADSRIAASGAVRDVGVRTIAISTGLLQGDSFRVRVDREGARCIRLLALGVVAALLGMGRIGSGRWAGLDGGRGTLADSHASLVTVL